MRKKLKEFFDMSKPAPLKWFLIGLIGQGLITWPLTIWLVVTGRL